MRVKRLAAVMTLALLASSTPASGQRQWSVEAGGFGKYTIFGDLIQLDNAPGVGGMVGLFILPNLAAEADISFSQTEGPLTDGNVTYRPFHARLSYHIPINEQLKLPLGIGYTLGVYDEVPTPNVYEDAFGALAGLKYYFKPSWAFNAELLLDRFPSPGNQEDPTADKGHWNTSIRAGVNWIYPSLEKCTVTIQPATATVTQGDSRTFTATARGERTGRECPGSVTFASTGNSISPSGLFTSRTLGASTVTASFRGRGQRATATANVNVNASPPPPPPVAVPTGPCLNSLDIRPDTGTVLRGETIQFTATARTCVGSDTTVAVTYSGGNVDQTGRFTAGNDTGVVQITGRVTVGGRALTDVANIRVTRLRSTVVNFDLNAAALDGASRSRLDRLITSLRANPRVTIRVEGHADTIPPRSRSAAASRRYNEQLSLARADSVTAYLLAQAVDRSRFEPRIRGFSFCSPAVPHRAPADYERDGSGRPLGERANRRVEIFELVMIEEEQVRWVCGGRAEPVTRATPGP